MGPWNQSVAYRSGILCQSGRGTSDSAIWNHLICYKSCSRGKIGRNGQRVPAIFGSDDRSIAVNHVCASGGTLAAESDGIYRIRIEY